ncbi:MAG: hypothetical protein ATN35_02505 [Epulopiscium sp. Nele67-Bin004]|nr:MAG: hypothetical protein ATN35_02505 [Epulopiscium sp. Nele67-Bin004]
MKKILHSLACISIGVVIGVVANTTIGASVEDTSPADVVEDIIEEDIKEEIIMQTPKEFERVFFYCQVDEESQVIIVSEAYTDNIDMVATSSVYEYDGNHVYTIQLDGELYIDGDEISIMNLEASFDTQYFEFEPIDLEGQFGEGVNGWAFGGKMLANNYIFNNYLIRGYVSLTDENDVAIFVDLAVE